MYITLPRKKLLKQMSNKNALIFLLEKYPEKKWDWRNLSANPNVTMEYVDAHLNDTSFKWDYRFLSMNPNLTMEYIEAHPEKKWNYSFFPP